MIIKIIPFQTTYNQQVIDLIIPIQQIEFKVPITLEDQPDLFMIPEFYQTNNGNFWVALDGEQVVGTIALIDSGEGVGTLRKMFVKANYRGKELQIAQKLLATLLAWATQRNFKGVYLGTAPILQAACRFYEKSGFSRIDKNDLPPNFPLMKVDSIFFEYLLP